MNTNRKRAYNTRSSKIQQDPTEPVFKQQRLEPDQKQHVTHDFLMATLRSNEEKMNSELSAIKAGLSSIMGEIRELREHD